MRGYIQCQIPILPVKDVLKTVEYYHDVLGFNLEWIWDDGGYAEVTCGEILLHFDKQEEISPTSAYLFVNDVDEVYAYYQKKGVNIIREIESKTWNVREFTFQDLNGHMFRVAQSLKQNQ